VCSLGPTVICDTAMVIINVFIDSVYVWPGDANYDGVVDQNDMLAIGVGFGATGAVRNNASLNWAPQYCVNWIDTLPGAVNMKHADCDGNGTVTYADTLAVVQNFSLTHPREGGMDEARSNVPELQLLFDQHTAYVGNVVHASLILGSSAFPLTNAYGLAFNLNFNSLLVDSSVLS